MATHHPFHDLFTFMNAEVAPDGTVLGHEQRCKYRARAWELRKYTASQRQGNWRTIDPKVLLEHMLRRCTHGSDGICHVAVAAKEDAHACVATIRARNRRYPPTRATIWLHQDQAAAAAAASQPLTARVTTAMTRRMSMRTRTRYYFFQPFNPFNAAVIDTSAKPHEGICFTRIFPARVTRTRYYVKRTAQRMRTPMMQRRQQPTATTSLCCVQKAQAWHQQLPRKGRPRGSNRPGVRSRVHLCWRCAFVI
jgi:hypothetical protein